MEVTTENTTPVRTGEARIKAEYLMTRTTDPNSNSIDKACDATVNGNTLEPDAKRPKLSKQEKKKLKGQNKHRPAPPKLGLAERLCPSLTNGKGNCTYPNCAYQHDVKEFLASKPADIKDECYLYETYGKCSWGLSCRFGGAHIDSDCLNVTKDDYSETSSTTSNSLTKDLQFKLRKHQYDFSKSEEIIKGYTAKRKKDKSDVTETTEEKPDDTEKNVDSHIGPVTDEDVTVNTREKKTIDWSNKLYLAPLTTVGNLPFRRVCKEFGADITCSEMAMASSLLQGGQQEWALVKRHASEDIFGIQLCGNNPYVMGKCTQLLDEQTAMDFVDINLGCPIDLVYRQGSGSGLIRREHVLESVINCMSKIATVPLTVKVRTGVYMDKNVAHNLIPKFRSWGASMVTLHGRSREQRYTKLADWDYIETCSQLASPMAFFGNGDILSYEDYKLRKESTSVSGIMLARGALIKPWLFTEIKEERHWDISSKERFEILQKFSNYGLEHWGSDSQGVEKTRRFLLEWLSFLHRYIPVGLLEVPPQQINERPPLYRGRDDMETLMASPNCADWVKISEMLMGPVPSTFVFLPKHKANSWK